MVKRGHFGLVRKLGALGSTAQRDHVLVTVCPGEDEEANGISFTHLTSNRRLSNGGTLHRAIESPHAGPII